MPALFAYLIAVGLLLGGGYGALTWLTASEPVKVVRHHPRPKPETPPTYEAARVSSTPREESAVKPNALDRPDAATVTKDFSSAPQPPQIEAHTNDSDNARARLAKTEPAPEPVQKQNDGAKTERPAQAPSSPPPAGSRSATSAGPNKATAHDRRSPVKREASRQGQQPLDGKQSEGKQPLAVMTLRTIEFPDGRRQTQLIPYNPHSGGPYGRYGGGAHIMALDEDDDD